MPHNRLFFGGSGGFFAAFPFPWYLPCASARLLLHCAPNRSGRQAGFHGLFTLRGLKWCEPSQRPIRRGKENRHSQPFTGSAPTEGRGRDRRGRICQVYVFPVTKVPRGSPRDYKAAAEIEQDRPKVFSGNILPTRRQSPCQVFLPWAAAGAAYSRRGVADFSGVIEIKSAVHWTPGRFPGRLQRIRQANLNRGNLSFVEEGGVEGHSPWVLEAVADIRRDTNTPVGPSRTSYHGGPRCEEQEVGNEPLRVAGAASLGHAGEGRISTLQALPATLAAPATEAGRAMGQPSRSGRDPSGPTFRRQLIAVIAFRAQRWEWPTSGWGHGRARRVERREPHQNPRRTAGGARTAPAVPTLDPPYSGIPWLHYSRNLLKDRIVRAR